MFAAVDLHVLPQPPAIEVVENDLARLPHSRTLGAPVRKWTTRSSSVTIIPCPVRYLGDCEPVCFNALMRSAVISAISVRRIAGGGDGQSHGSGVLPGDVQGDDWEE